MRAILLAAGLGTRLKPLTNTIPKCLMPIKGKPLLEIWLQRLSDSGVVPFLINTNYLSEKVEDFIERSSFRNDVTLIHETELLGTAGTLNNNLDFFQNEDGFLIHSDNYCLADLGKFIEAHKNRPSGCLITMMTFRTKNPSSCGIVELNKENVVVGFHEKVASSFGNLANGAVYLLSSEFIKKMRIDFSHAKDFSTEILPRLVGKIYSWETSDTFIDIGTPTSYEKANNIH